MVLATLALCGCATSGSSVGLEASNSPSQCANQEALHRIPQSQQHDYMKRCAAGYNAQKNADSGDAFKLNLPHKDKQAQ